MRSSIRTPFALALLCLAALLTIACQGGAEKAPDAAAAAKPAPAGKVPVGPTTIVAVVNGENITLADVDKEAAAQLRQLRRQAVEQEHALRQGALEAMVAKRLVEAEAKKRGVSEEDLLKAEIEEKTPPPTEVEMREFYANNQARMPGPYEQMKDQLGPYLRNQKAQARLMEYIGQLRSASQVAMTLPEAEMPRVEVAATGPSRGPANAPVTVVVFSDFECQFCAKSKPVLDQIASTYGDKVRIVFRDYPLPFHTKASKAGEAGHCADAQGKFWAYHDYLFANQAKLEVADLKAAALAVGLDAAAFDACLDGGKMAEAVTKNTEAGREAGVSGTPAFFINGLPLDGAQPFEAFKPIIDAELGVTPAPAQPAQPAQG
ncbi:MAG: thioredoxin domain-containing protein [Acidobacteria bacterium]|jgi:protein-disulfide isomerase|nr:thioredoxin domain-containing protein [Acidobacteriota bacterium]